MTRRLLLLAACLVPLAPGQAPPDLLRGFQQPPAEARPMMRWWWFGPAVTAPELERELWLMRDNGIGGVEIQPVYPLALDDRETGIRNLPFLSGEFLEAVRFAAAKGRELGLRVDITLGSGWPYGGPHIAAAQAASRLRLEKVKPAGRRVPPPALGAGEQVTAAFAVEGRDRYREIPYRDGVEAPAAGEVWYFIAGRTGQQVKRSSVGAEGFVLDHMDREALGTHLRAVGDRLMRAFGPHPPYAVFCDSLEVYGGDWTPSFLGEFRKRRGYDLKPLLPALFTDMGPKTQALRHDWGRTLTELTEENFYRPLHEWAKKHGTRFRIQGYGLPPAAVSSFADADLPEGEGSHWKILRASRWAASASHILGRPVTHSETWTWLHSPSFRATPLDLKAEADLHFLQGINQLIGHGWPYTPPGVEYPGWRLYAAAVFNEANPWFHAMPEIARYLHRMSWLLRQGKPANDVALYLSNADGWAHLTPGRVDLSQTLRERVGDAVGRVIEGGYNLDFFDDALVDRVLQSYRVVVAPNVETMPVETARKLAAFARQGGVVVPTRRLPDAAPGYRATAEDHAAVREAVKAFAGNLAADETQLAARLRTLARPDVLLEPAAPDFGFIRRSIGGAEAYFLVNAHNRPLRARATFRVSGLEPEWWDPMTGRASAARVEARSAGGVTVALDMAGLASAVLVFSKRAAAAPVPSGAARTLDLSAGWTVTVGSAKPTRWEKLRSWTDDDALRHFSGLATYEKTFVLPADFPRAALRLDFGEAKPVEGPQPRNGYVAMLEAPVREAAVVWVGGRRVGAAWCAPYSVDLAGLVEPGENRLRIVVGNTAMNYMAGRSQPDYRLLHLRYGPRFDPQDMDKIAALPSGLLGAVRLIGVGK